MPSKRSAESTKTTKETFEQQTRRYIKNLRGEAADPDIHVRSIDQIFKPV